MPLSGSYKVEVHSSPLGLLNPHNISLAPFSKVSSMCSNVAKGENAEKARKRNNFQKLQGQHSKEIVLFAISSYKRRLGTVSF